MSWIDGELLGFDLETTGTNVYRDRPVSWSLVSFKGGDITDVFDGIIDPGMPIPADAIAVHGITNERVQDEGLAMDVALDIIVEVIDKANKAGIPLVGMNLSYDLTLMDSCLRHSDVVPRALTAPGPVVDLRVIDKRVDQYRRGKRTLTDLAPFYGVDRGERHEATSDVIATVQTVRALVAKHGWIGRQPLDALHRMQTKWHKEQQQSLSEYFVVQGSDPIPKWEWWWPLFGREGDAIPEGEGPFDHPVLGLLEYPRADFLVCDRCRAGVGRDNAGGYGHKDDPRWERWAIDEYPF